MWYYWLFVQIDGIIFPVCSHYLNIDIVETQITHSEFIRHLLNVTNKVIYQEDAFGYFSRHRNDEIWAANILKGANKLYIICEYEGTIEAYPYSVCYIVGNIWSFYVCFGCFSFHCLFYAFIVDKVISYNICLLPPSRLFYYSFCIRCIYCWQTRKLLFQFERIRSF